ncbi:pentatricopeptide repeat-containing protein At2g13600 [Cryptomeria japonica]|uniref:pentatricopeptide repeat-containing protein At2g13600 n=1 Tax=Cryptomeria japonica TaxID=3369 RepID=UPI0025AC10D3|nr:pentatricopeptide repeat-containing protein At2g13600 [Cryptomeria japonica]
MMEKMKQLTLISYIRLLQNSINPKSLTDVRQAHAHLISNGYMLGVFLGNRLIDMYVKCGSIVDACHVFDKMAQRDVTSWNSLITGYTKTGDLENARKLFDKMIRRDVVSWTALISGYDQQGHNEAALRFFSQMVQSCTKPNQFTFASALSSCASLLAFNSGKQVHGYIVRTGFESDVFVGSALIDLYAKCGSLDDARRVFDKMPEQSAVSWTTLMVGYAQNQSGEETLRLYCRMRRAEMKQDRVALVSALIACGSLASLVHGRIVHAKVITTGFCTDSFVGNTVVDMYAKCGALRDACQMFDRMSEWNIVSWTALIAGYVQNGYSEEGLKLFQKLLWTDVKPNPFTFASTLSACASLALLELGKQLHVHIIGTGHESFLTVANSLVTVYAKCGSIDYAAQVFYNIACKDLVSWNAMIAGYAHNGDGKEALQVFEVMLQTDMKPDQITFLAILTACCHAGLVDEGCYYFDLMRRKHNTFLTNDHYACMIDLLGRAGRICEAEDIINNMTIEPDAVVWKTLLGACRIHANVEVGERAAKHLISWEPETSSTYVLLSNVYAAASRWSDVAKVRKLMKDRGVKKEAGHSWIQVRDRVYTFIAEDTSHPHSEQIYAMVERLAMQM